MPFLSLVDGASFVHHNYYIWSPSTLGKGKEWVGHLLCVAPFLSFPSLVSLVHPLATRDAQTHP